MEKFLKRDSANLTEILYDKVENVGNQKEKSSGTMLDKDTLPFSKNVLLFFTNVQAQLSSRTAFQNPGPPCATDLSIIYVQQLAQISSKVQSACPKM